MLILFHKTGMNDFYKKIKAIVLKYLKIFYISKIKKKNYIFVILLTIFTVGLDTVGIGILLPIGEYILNYETGQIPDTYSWKILKNFFLYLGLKPDIVFIVVFAILIIVMRQAVTFLRVLFTETVRYQVIKNFRKILFSKFLKQDSHFTKKYNTGIYNNIINLEVDNIGKAMILPLDNVSGMIFIISYLILMMVVSLKATLVVISCIFLIGILIKRIINYVHLVSANIIQINNRFSQNLIDRLMAIKLIRMNNSITNEEIINKKILNDQFINNIKLTKIKTFTDCTIEPILLMIAVPVIILAIKIDFPLAKLGVFIVILARFIPVFKTTITSIQQHASLYASIKNMLNLITLINNNKEIRSGKLDVPKKITKIKFEDVSFNYDKSRTRILNKFSCEFKGHLINGVVGTSGVGKTTLVNMIPRLIEPNEGVININNINLKDINADSIRATCSFIEQKPAFIRGTILEHIMYNFKKMDIKKAKEAAILANAHKFIMKLSNNYYYSLGESGTGLSVGQLQRLDIARGIASNKEIMILDEPTSNLDEKNTVEVLLTLKKINKYKNTTIILITHDTNVLKYCDNVIKM